MHPGISSYTFTWAVGVPGSPPARPLTPLDLVDKASFYGVSVLQIADNMPLEKMPQDIIGKLRSYAESKGISIEMGSRGLTPGHTTECLIVAETLKSPILRMVIDNDSFRPDVSSVISITKDLIPELKKRNIKLAIENHDRFRAREFEKIILETDPSYVGICLDSVNSMGAGEGFDLVSEILAPYTINLHIKDFTIYRVSHKMGFVIEGRPAGKGMLDIPSLIDKINTYRQCRSAILELWTPPAETLEYTIAKENEWADVSVEYLKTVIV